ncbi:MAG: hypothetical protein N2038_10375 [Geminicoccaceae bacterium]|nr:hypothetical protein [Geminicoccaceae bacterium]
MTTPARRAATLAAWLVLLPPAPTAAEPDCAVSLEIVQERLIEAPRYEFEGPLLAPFLALWPARPAGALSARPDRATVFVRADRSLLVALSREGCVVGAFETELATVVRALRATVGPAI